LNVGRLFCSGSNRARAPAFVYLRRGRWARARARRKRENFAQKITAPHTR